MTTLRRTVIALAWGIITSISVAACASSEDVITSGTVPQNDASAGGGAAGAAGAPGEGSCNPTFCPATGMGSPCCVSPNGPCGSDFGNGCVSSVAADAGP